MTLAEYIAQTPGITYSELALKLGVTPPRLTHLKHSLNWPPLLAMKAEEATNGGLDASKLSPVVARARETRRD